jgi:hypothetical protein
MEQLREQALYEIKRYIEDNELTADEFTEDYHQDTLIQRLFNRYPKFASVNEVDACVGGSIHNLSECMDVYKEYMENNGFPLEVDVIKIMNMCWYIAGDEIPYIDITQYIQDYWDAQAEADPTLIAESDSDEEIEPSQ